MAEILVKPPELRDTAAQIREHAKKLQTALDAVEAEMRALGPGTFEGVRADNLRARYNKVRERIFQFKPLLDRFANDLGQAADRFQAADNG
jgi:WXG100 family type VII secretion target